MILLIQTDLHAYAIDGVLKYALCVLPRALRLALYLIMVKHRPRPREL